jgi:electron transfer flavoprotein alpha subunit
MALNVLVFAERRGGELKRPGLEAVGVARRLASSSGGRVTALALGPGASAAAGEMARHGADRLLVCEAAHLDLYAPEAYAATLAAAARSVEADIVLAAGTAMGRDLMPRAAARLGAACLSDVVEIEWSAEKGLQGRRPVYSGKALARVSIPRAKPAFATLRPNVFHAAPIDGNPATAETVAIDPALTEQRIRVRTVRVEKPTEQELDVAEASIIVSGGRGLKGPENFMLIRDLAKELGAAVGASRAVVDSGWMPHAHQVGQTGKVVSPNLYVACGISGAIQHLAGMSSSKVIVAINKDPEAPIFKVADYGIVGDLFDVLPKLTEEIRRLKQDS